MSNLTKHANKKSDAMVLTIEFRFKNGRREEVSISEDTGIIQADCVRYKGSIFTFHQEGEADFYIERGNDYFLDLDVIARS